MDFIEKNSDGSYSFDDSNRDEMELLSASKPMLIKHVIDEKTTEWVKYNTH